MFECNLAGWGIQCSEVLHVAHINSKRPKIVVTFFEAGTGTKVGSQGGKASPQDQGKQPD